MKARLTILALIGSVTLMCVGCSESPEEGFEKFNDAAEAGDWGTVYDRLDKETQGKMDGVTKMMAGASQMAKGFNAVMGTDDSGEDLSKLSGRDRFIRLCEKNEKMSDQFKRQTLVSCTVNGDSATLTVKGEDGETKMSMVKEDGKWKFSGGS